MVETAFAGVILIAFGLLGTWYFSPALFGVLGSLALTSLGAWLAFQTVLDRA